MATDNPGQATELFVVYPGGAADPAADQIFQQMAAQGQSFFNASGDNDAFTGLIHFPGDTPYITQVGGTTLTTSGPGGAWVSETVWNWGNGIGSGGGISTQYPIPSWQTDISMTANQGSTTMRNMPDVALTADNVYVRADGVTTTWAAPVARRRCGRALPRWSTSRRRPAASRRLASSIRPSMRLAGDELHPGFPRHHHRQQHQQQQPDQILRRHRLRPLHRLGHACRAEL